MFQSQQPSSPSPDEPSIQRSIIEEKLSVFEEMIKNPKASFIDKHTAVAEGFQLLLRYEPSERFIAELSSSDPTYHAIEHFLITCCSNEALIEHKENYEYMVRSMKRLGEIGMNDLTNFAEYFGNTMIDADRCDAALRAGVTMDPFMFVKSGLLPQDIPLSEVSESQQRQIAYYSQLIREVSCLDRVGHEKKEEQSTLLAGMTGGISRMRHGIFPLVLEAQKEFLREYTLSAILPSFLQNVKEGTVAIRDVERVLSMNEVSEWLSENPINFIPGKSTSSSFLTEELVQEVLSSFETSQQKAALKLLQHFGNNGHLPLSSLSGLPDSWEDHPNAPQLLHAFALGSEDPKVHLYIAEKAFSHRDSEEWQEMLLDNFVRSPISTISALEKVAQGGSLDLIDRVVSLAQHSYAPLLTDSLRKVALEFQYNNFAAVLLTQGSEPSFVATLQQVFSSIEEKKG